MAITVYGVSPSIGETEWAILHRVMGRGSYHEVVDAPTDFAVTAGGGTRQVNVSGGDMAVCGTLVRSSGTISANSGTNSSGNPRIDIVVLQVDWSGTVDTAGSIVIVAGTPAASPVAPTLTRVAGTLWQVKLAQVAVAAGATSFTAANITQATPQRRIPVVYSSAADTTQTVGAAAAEKEIGPRVTVADPGWPYKLRGAGSVNFGPVTAGRTDSRILADDVLLSRGRAGQLNAADAVMSGDTDVGTRTGPCVVKFTAIPVAQTGTATVAAGSWTVTVLPS